METPARPCPPARPSAELGFRRGRRVITAPQAESLLLLQMPLLSNVALLISTPICFLLWFLSGTKAWLFALVGNSIQSSLLKGKKMRVLATLPALSPQTHLKASGAEHRAQVTAARVSIGGGGGGAAPSASSGGTAQRAAGSCTLSAKALELFFLVCLFLLPSHARNCQGRDIRLSVFNIIGLGRGACGPPPALGGVSRGSRCRADGLGAVQTDFLSGEAVHWGGA